MIYNFNQCSIPPKFTYPVGRQQPDLGLIVPPSSPLVVVITGVTRGLGRAMAGEFALRGHRVVGCARTKAHIEALRNIYPGHNFDPVNVAIDTEVRAWAERVVTVHGPPELVINNAGVVNVRAPLWRVPDRDFSQLVDTNIKGIANVIRHFCPSMIGRGRGVVVNFTSRWGTRIQMQMGPYCATKWAVVALTRVLAEELEPEGIAAVALNPGIVATDMLRKYLGDIAAPPSDFPDPDEWAKIAVPLIIGLCLKDTGKLRSVPNPRKPPQRTEIDAASMC